VTDDPPDTPHRPHAARTRWGAGGPAPGPSRSGPAVDLGTEEGCRRRARPRGPVPVPDRDDADPGAAPGDGGQGPEVPGGVRPAGRGRDRIAVRGRAPPRP